MAIGQSGGRSAGNRQNGPRRATQRERDLVDPPGRHEWEKVKVDGEPWVLTPRAKSLGEFIAWSLWCATIAALVVLLAAWWGYV